MQAREWASPGAKSAGTSSFQNWEKYNCQLLRPLVHGILLGWPKLWGPGVCGVRA